MRIFIYNPEHDLSLAANSRFYTPPKAASVTRRRFGWMMALWADDGDWVVVDDVEEARQMCIADGRVKHGVKFVDMKHLTTLCEKEISALEIVPWGWDEVLVGRLLRTNERLSAVVPTPATLEAIRRLSGRQFAAKEFLGQLVSKSGNYIGSANVYVSEDALLSEVSHYDRCVLKSPWSCSGRGVRIVEGKSLEDNALQSLQKWVRATLSQQGSMMLEPYYHNVQDFAMEFWAYDDGVQYLGLSVFHTQGGFYQGNDVLTEEEKMSILERYVSREDILLLRQRVLELTTKLFAPGTCNHYTGPFGIDMMIVKGEVPDTYLIHPCVEMNLRMTMGHLSLCSHPHVGLG